MSSSAPKLASYDDLLALPDDVRAEIINGQVVTSPAPLPRHAKTQGALRRFLGGPFDDDDGFGGPGGWWIFGDVDARLTAHDIVRPDLVGWRRERLSNPANVRPIEVVPDWVCEVLSPSNEAVDRVHKRSLYARAGVPYYWIVDPAPRTLEALQLKDDHWLELGAWDDGAAPRIPPFDSVELPLGRLFLPREAQSTPPSS